MSIDLTGVQHHPAIEEIVDVLCKRTENRDRGFYRTEAAFFLCKMASNMRAVVVTGDLKEIPINMYLMALATSGYGKGHSVAIMEQEFLKGFMRRFLTETFLLKSEENWWHLANERAVMKNSDPQAEFDAIEKESRKYGPFLFTFDSGSPEGIKEMRQKLLLGAAGALSCQVDEIGSNLEKSSEVLTVFLELFDQGLVKRKLTKNSPDNLRSEEMEGKTPTNMLLFGTPSKLLDGSSTETAFYQLLETGYARRCIFGFGTPENKSRHSKSARDIYLDKINPANNIAVTKWANHFTSLADPGRFGWRIVINEDVGIMLTEYQMDCERRGEALKEFQTTSKAELDHRYFKVLKLAGAYAFVDGSNEIEMDHLMSAILLVEESGVAFQKILAREKVHVRLGRYIAEVGTEVTLHDLNDALPFLPKSASSRNDMINLAMAWGYRNNVIIKKTFRDGLEFFQGATLKETNLEEMLLSYSNNFAYEYEPVMAPWLSLGMDLVIAEDVDDQDQPNGMPMHWANHHFKGKHRSEDHVLHGFNMLVLDVDGGITLELAHELLAEIKFMTYTTKRHTPEKHRFRLLIPINYHLELDKEEYSELVRDVVNWLPFKATEADIDSSSGQRSKKWLTNPSAIVKYNDEGAMLDILPFIPKTKKNEDYRQNYKSLESMDNLERWFAQRMAQGNRNSTMIKFALALVDDGMDLISVQRTVHAFNKKLSAPLADDEIDQTVMVTVAKRITKRAA